MVTSNVIKTLEKIIENRIGDHLVNGINKNQIGFIKNMGCEVHLLKIIHTLKARKKKRISS